MTCSSQNVKQLITANCSYVYQTYANLGTCLNPFPACVTTIFSAVAQQDNTTVYIQYYPPFNGEIYVYVNGNQVALVPPNDVGVVTINSGDTITLKAFQGVGGGAQIFVTICSTAPLVNSPSSSGGSSTIVYIIVAIIIVVVIIAFLVLASRGLIPFFV